MDTELYVWLMLFLLYINILWNMQTKILIFLALTTYYQFILLPYLCVISSNHWTKSIILLSTILLQLDHADMQINLFYHADMQINLVEVVAKCLEKKREREIHVFSKNKRNHHMGKSGEHLTQKVKIIATNMRILV